jgi:hypothetical protein
MAHSYRSDQSDAVYSDQPGPVVVAGTKTSEGSVGGSADARVKVYSGDGAIDVRSHIAIITKGSAAAMTLAAPTSDGIDIKVSAGSAFAHVVTATGLLHDGVTGGAKNTYTTAAFVGSGAHLVSYNGKWHLMAKNLGSTA